MKVDITTAGHTIIVEGEGDLDTVAAKALELWHATRFGDRGFGFPGTVVGAPVPVDPPPPVEPRVMPDVDLREAG